MNSTENEKNFQKFIRIYLLNLALIALSILLLVLASREVLPDIFRTVGFIVLLGDIFGFSMFAKKYKQ